MTRGSFGEEIPPIERRLLQTLAAARGRVVSRTELTQSGWQGRPASRNSLDVHIGRLRRRLVDSGVEIKTIRRRGYALKSVDIDQIPPTNQPEEKQ